MMMQVSLVHHFTHNQQLHVQESNGVGKSSVKLYDPQKDLSVLNRIHYPNVSTHWVWRW